MLPHDEIAAVPIARVGGQPVSLAFITGDLNNLAQHLALAVKRAPVPQSQGPWDTHGRRAAMLASLWTSFLVGALMAGAARWTRFGADVRYLGLHSHFQLWGFLGALAGCLGGILIIFGLFFRIGILLVLTITIVHAIAISKGAAGFHAALAATETAIVFGSLIFIGPGKFSVDKT